MTDKNAFSEDSFLNNALIEDNYDHLVLNKVTKEFIKSSSEIKKRNNTNTKTKISEECTKKIILAKSEGMLGLHFCDNCSDYDLNINDNIIIKIENELEYATVIETGDMVRFRFNCIDFEHENVPAIERKASQSDNDKYLLNVENSHKAKNTFLELVEKLSLEMKLVDIHFQFDRKKLFFFYTANGRVDFRELAKKLAAKYRTRIELRQIGVRDEAKRIGGIATCGREYCCASFINNFKRITTDIAVENNISTSISKYTGPCGKLKCCLSFEL